jgi:GT2 family glycosyltransferase
VTDSPQLSIVVPVYDNWWLTERCLRHLGEARERGGAAFETIVVDNASTDQTPSAIAEFPWVRYRRHETNRNFAGACNAGAAMATAPIALFLNNDAYPLDGAFEPLIAAFARDDVVIAGGALFFEDMTTQAAGLVLLPDDHWHYYCRNLDGARGDVARSRDALAVSGAAMAVRTKWFLDGGGFDETFVNGFEDVDLCLRAQEQGRTIAYVGDARFVHYEAASAGRYDNEARNERLFYERRRAQMAPLPRTLRGSVGAIAVQGAPDADPLLVAALCDLEAALRAFGHPVVRGRPAAWRRLVRKFREGAILEWFTSRRTSPGIAIARDGAFASIRSVGAASIEVPWLPCAAPERLASLRVRASAEATCATVGIAGAQSAAIALPQGCRAVRVTTEMLLYGVPVELACVVHAGLTDGAAFGNVLLAQAGLPAVVAATDGAAILFPDDVALLVDPASPGALAAAIARFTTDPQLRATYGRLIAADSQRRFSPRRSAIRVVDLLCAARFGWERPAEAAASGRLHGEHVAGS